MNEVTKKKPRICVLFTGGTIGMVRGADGTIQLANNPHDFLDAAPEIKEFAEVDFKIVMNKDSTNMTPQDWTLMAKAVYDKRNDNYQGFVIAHGTDTMHYSASALAFALGPNLNFPVVFTGSQAIPEVLHGDAKIKLIRAVRVACEDLAEVVISFGDYIYRGCRTQKNDERQFQAFSSPAISPVGEITEQIRLTPNAKRQNLNPIDIELQEKFSTGIIQIPMTPGLETELVLPVLESEKCKGIVLQAFGAGNIPHARGFSFYDFIQRATKINKPVLIVSQFPANSTLSSRYASGMQAIRAGAIPTGNMTNAAAIVKFRWALEKVGNENINYLTKIREIIEKPYVSEME
jgi:L-asparaginase